MTILWLITNARAGTLSLTRMKAEQLAARFKAAGFDVRSRGDESVGRQIELGVAEKPDLVVVAGGDGTIASAVHAHRERPVPIGILPFGTMNMIATELGLPTDPDAAADVIIAGHTRRVDLGRVGGHLVLHSALFGAPARIGRHRETHRGTISPRYLVALAVHALSTLRRDPVLTVTSQSAAKSWSGRSVIVVIGDLGERLLPVPQRERVDSGRLTAIVARTDRASDALELLLHGALGWVNDDSRADVVSVTAVTVTGPRPKIHVLLDGERLLLPAPIEVAIEHNALEVFAPPEPAAPPA